MLIKLDENQSSPFIHQVYAKCK